MKYSKYLKTLKHCPFCHDITSRTLADSSGAILTYAQAPYHKYHLLVIPKRHVNNIEQLTWEDNVCIMSLIVAAIKALDKLGHNDCTILMRNGATKRSVGHIHYHIIPGGVIEDASINNKLRRMLSDSEEAALKEELKNITSNL